MLGLGRLIFIGTQLVIRTNWYRVYSDGWIEQGGLAINTGYSTTQSFTLHKTFKNTKYTVLITPHNGGDSWFLWGKPTSTTNFETGGFHNNTSFCWYACGY